MKIQNPKTGQLVNVPKKHEAAIRKAISSGNDAAVERLVKSFAISKAQTGKMVIGTANTDDNQTVPNVNVPEQTYQGGIENPLNQESIINRQTFNPALTKSVLDYDALRNEHPNVYGNSDEINKLNNLYKNSDPGRFRFKPNLIPLSGNKYLQRSATYLNQGINHAFDLADSIKKGKPVNTSYYDYNGPMGGSSMFTETTRNNPTGTYFNSIQDKMAFGGRLPIYQDAGLTGIPGISEYLSDAGSQTGFPNTGQFIGDNYTTNAPPIGHEFSGHDASDFSNQDTSDQTLPNSFAQGNEKQKRKMTPEQKAMLANKIGQGVAIGSNIIQSGINAGKGVADILGSQQQNRETQEQEAKLFTQSVFSDGLNVTPYETQGYGFEGRNKLAQEGTEIKTNLAPGGTQSVADYQRFLNSRGANIKVDGAWGPLTQKAYETFAITPKKSAPITPQHPDFGDYDTRPSKNSRFTPNINVPQNTNAAPVQDYSNAPRINMPAFNNYAQVDNTSNNLQQSKNISDYQMRKTQVDINQNGPLKNLNTNSAPSSQYGNPTTDYFIKQMQNNGNKVLLVDKGQQKIFYTDKDGVIKSYPVITGKNSNPKDVTAPYNLEQMEKFEKTNPQALLKSQVTPVGVSAIESNPDIYGSPGFSLTNPNYNGVAVHTLYPEELNERNKRINSPEFTQRCFSWGCINLKTEDVKHLTGLFGNNQAKPDSIYTMDSRLSIPENQAAFTANSRKMGGETYFENGGMQIKDIGGKGEKNVEIEGKEHVKLPNGFSQEVQGPSHADGGIALNLPAGSKIYSEHLKIPVEELREMKKSMPKAQEGMEMNSKQLPASFLENLKLPKKGKVSIADIAKKFETKKYVDLAKDKNADDTQKQTAELMIAKNNEALESIFAMQENLKKGGYFGQEVQNKAMQDDMPTAKYGGLRKFQAGGNPGPTPPTEAKDIVAKFKESPTYKYVNDATNVSEAKKRLIEQLQYNKASTPEIEKAISNAKTFQDLNKYGDILQLGTLKLHPEAALHYGLTAPPTRAGIQYLIDHKIIDPKDYPSFVGKDGKASIGSMKDYPNTADAKKLQNIINNKIAKDPTLSKEYATTNYNDHEFYYRNPEFKNFKFSSPDAQKQWEAQNSAYKHGDYYESGTPGLYIKGYSDQPAATPAPEIQYKDRTIERNNYLKPDVNLEMNLGIPLPNIYGRQPLNYYKIQPNYIEAPINQPYTNDIDRAQRAFITNATDLSGTGMANRLQGLASGEAEKEQRYYQTDQANRQSRFAADQHNAQARTQADMYNQGTWYNQLEDPIRRREGAIDTQQRMDTQSEIENARRQQSFGANKELAKDFYPNANLSKENLLSMIFGASPISNTAPKKYKPGENPDYDKQLVEQYNQLQTTLPKSKYGGKTKIKPKLKSRK